MARCLDVHPVVGRETGRREHFCVLQRTFFRPILRPADTVYFTQYFFPHDSPNATSCLSSTFPDACSSFRVEGRICSSANSLTCPETDASGQFLQSVRFRTEGFDGSTSERRSLPQLRVLDHEGPRNEARQDVAPRSLQNTEDRVPPLRPSQLVK